MVIISFGINQCRLARQSFGERLVKDAAKMAEARKQRLLFVNNSSSAFLNHHLPLAEAMQEELETHVAVTCDSDDDARRIEERGITVHPIRLSRKTANPLRVAGEVRAVRRVIESVQPDVVNAINLKSLLVTALAMGGLRAARSSSRLVGTITGLGYMYSGESVKRRLLRSATMTALRRVLPKLRHALVFSNTDDRRLFLSNRIGSPDCMCAVPVPGVDAEVYAWSPEPGEGFRVVLPARMLWEKGVGEFVAAAGILRQRGIVADCVLAGGVDEGNPAAIDARQLQEWNRDGVVRWVGHQSDMPGLLASAHVVCLPSYYREGFPRVLAEAMACGRAVVTTDAPGCRDAVLGLDSGLLVPPRDAVALAGALELLWSDPERLREMGRRGREAVLERFSQSAITATMRGLLTDASSAAPLVSVIVPVFNGERTIGDCLDSVLSQSLAEIEVIVVDDASVDGTRKIVEDYAARDGRVELVINAANMKSYAARKLGFDRARGRYIATCDCDDRMPPDALRLLFGVAERSGADIVHGRARELDSGGTGRTHGRTLPVYDPFAVKTGEAFVVGMLRNFRGWNLWGKLFRREVWRRATHILPDSPDARWHTADDLLTCFAMGLEAERYLRISDIVYLYRQPETHAFSSEETAPVNARDHLEVLRELSVIAGKKQLASEFPGLLARLTRHVLLSMVRNLHPDAAVRNAVALEIEATVGTEHARWAVERGLLGNESAGREGVTSGAGCAGRFLSLPGRLLRHVCECGSHECWVTLRRACAAAQRRGWRTVLREMTEV